MVAGHPNYSPYCGWPLLNPLPVFPFLPFHHFFSPYLLIFPLPHFASSLLSTLFLMGIRVMGIRELSDNLVVIR